MIDPGIVTNVVLYCHVGNKELSVLHQVLGRDRWMSSKVYSWVVCPSFSHFNKPSIHHACGARSPLAIGFPSQSTWWDRPVPPALLPPPEDVSFQVSVPGGWADRSDGGGIRVVTAGPGTPFSLQSESHGRRRKQRARRTDGMAGPGGELVGGGQRLPVDRRMPLQQRNMIPSRLTQHTAQGKQVNA